MTRQSKNKIVTWLRQREMVRMNGLEMGNVMKTPIRRSCIPERDLPSAEFFLFSQVVTSRAGHLHLPRIDGHLFWSTGFWSTDVPPQKRHVPVFAAFVAHAALKTSHQLPITFPRCREDGPSRAHREGAKPMTT